jgi:hypothetical protein
MVVLGISVSMMEKVAKVVKEKDREAGWTVTSTSMLSTNRRCCWNVVPAGGVHNNFPPNILPRNANGSAILS